MARGRAAQPWEGFEGVVSSGEVSVRELSHHTTQVIAAAEERRRREGGRGTLAVTRHGQLIGLYVPMTGRGLGSRLLAIEGNEETFREAEEDLRAHRTRRVGSAPS